MDILVVDGDRKIRNLLDVTLKAQDYRCTAVSYGEAALSLVSANNPDIVLLELVLPDMDGAELIQAIRDFSDVPIIVVSGRKEDSDKVVALDAGADDYLTKPFSVEELLARIRVMERRFLRGVKEETVFVNGDLRIDYASGSVSVAGVEIHLTPAEYKLLCLLTKDVGRVLPNTYLTREIWGDSWDHHVMTLRVFMATLRKKLADAGGERERIRTHTGVGYRLLKE